MYPINPYVKGDYALMSTWPQFAPGEPYKTWKPPMPQVYVPHQFVHPYMEVYPAPALTRLRKKDATVFDYRMGSANSHLVERPGWSHQLFEEEDDYDLDDLMDDLGMDEEDVMALAIYGAAAQEAAKKKTPFRPFKKISELFTKTPSGKTKAEEMVVRTKQIAKSLQPSEPEKPPMPTWQKAAIGVGIVSAVALTGAAVYKLTR
jgi:hypothetical protein